MVYDDLRGDEDNLSDGLMEGALIELIEGKMTNLVKNESIICYPKKVYIIETT